MGGRDRDETTGEFTEEYPQEDFLEALATIGPAGTTEIAEEVGCDRRTAYLKLQSIEDEDLVTSRKVGNALLWELA